ncbi:branched-chain amino acid ABC transporter permease [Methyloradius palustris]|uniref:Branched-chain amino acid ABC transporter permease n=2 Tax=Methyloradius palustris TaxID=2778876 RepID=A0A8D5GEM3_9PROT|nr:branched-chain amino acid ABC transporter permease [Methyloradius palustris]
MLLASANASALTSDEIIGLAIGDNEPRIAVLNTVMAKGDMSAIPFLQQLQDDAVKTKGKSVYIVTDEATIDALTGKPVDLPEDADDVVNNNQMGSELDAAIATLNLLSTDPKVRLDAAKSLLGTEANDARLAIIKQVEAKETESKIHDALAEVRSSIELTSPDKATRLAAAEALSKATNANIKQMLSTRLAPDGETDPEVKTAIQDALKSIDSHLALFDRLGQLFTGISLGSILLLAALGLAVTYGLMGVINMAHGEMMMIGAYVTYAVQNIFIQHFPGGFQWYLLAAIPAAFIITALVGIVLEKTVIRFLYGRPLETLLATWGVSLILIQAVRTIFGAQNVSVENPAWMSGGIEFASNLVLPYNRILIIAFAIGVLLLVWLMISKTRLGLFIRAVTQNRGMASCIGVNTSKIDALAFGLGSGIAGLAGVALSQIGNVGPALGQSYIVDSFIVVVLGGVGQLAGAVYAAMGLGILSKVLEGFAGAVLAKIFILVMVVIFIQKRPQGLFAFKGRQID